MSALIGSVHKAALEKCGGRLESLEKAAEPNKAVVITLSEK